MNKTKRIDVGRAARGVVFAFATACILLAVGSVAAQTQRSFTTPEDAVKALEAAVKASDRDALLSIFGPEVTGLVSGDQVADANDFIEFAANLEAKTRLEKDGDQKFTLLIGEDEWPFAVPIVKDGDAWKFDTKAGVEEVINRRIGANEIDAMLVCQIYAIAQKEYFDGGDWDGDQVSEYAQKIASEPGQKDGLFWEQVTEDDVESPLGPVFAYAAAEGYQRKGTGNTESGAPFHGYNFKILFGQGPSAPGGKYDYIINGNMIGGFALVAFPATYGNSGIMTFMINQQGRVYEKDLGPETAAKVAAMTTYDPDPTWSLSYVD
jgi:hypothetical protein